MPRVTINGAALDFPQVGTILDALEFRGIEIPHLCHDPRLKPVGACRLCVVDLARWPRWVTACNTPLAEGMKIETHTPEIEGYRRVVLQLLSRGYPEWAIGAQQEQQFHGPLHSYVPSAAGRLESAGVDDSHPYIHVDMSRCILCYRCVRICDEVQGQHVWSVRGRGANTRIVPDGPTLGQSSCVSCGACVDTCPTSALEDKSVMTLGEPTAWTRTTCPYCGTGCEMNVGTRDDRITCVRPVLDAPVSKGHLCVKGRYAFDFVDAPDRITSPMVRESASAEWRCVSWPEAMDLAATRLRNILDRHGSGAVGVLGSARATNEENYLAQKFARVVLGTNNVDCCARVCHAPSAAALGQVFGAGAATSSFDDIERAHCILVFGCNPTENHPIVGARIQQAAERGAGLIVVDPRRIGLARYADCYLPVRPGANLPLLNAMAFTIVQEGLVDPQFIADRVEGWEAFQKFIRDWQPERVSQVCGVDAVLIRQAARLYATRKPAISFHGLGVTEHIQGVDGVLALANLALLTGNLGKPGTGINPLRGQNNVQGAAHMGCEPGHLPGYTSLGAGRELVESVWSEVLPTSSGLDLMQMMEAADAGRLQALWAIGYDIRLTNPDTHFTLRALRNLELLIVQDMFLNETAREFGHVFFPAASSFEKDGTFMNAERRVQRVRRALHPRGDSLPDWEIICRLASAMGKERAFHFHSPQDVWDEVRAVWKAGAGLSYQRLEQGGLQWPCPSEEHPGTSLLHGDGFSSGKRAALQRIGFQPSDEQVTQEYPFLLVTGRNLYQFNAGTMTLRTPNLQLRPCDTIDLSPEDAQRLRLSEGNAVRVRSHHGEAVLPLHITETVKAGEAFATFHLPSSQLNFLVGPQRDPVTHTPEYKITAVRIEAA